MEGKFASNNKGTYFCNFSVQEKTRGGFIVVNYLFAFMLKKNYSFGATCKLTVSLIIL